VESGSIVIFPHGNAHAIGSQVHSRPQSMAQLLPGILQAAGEDRIPDVEYGGGGEAARLVCGYVHCDQRFNPLIGALPHLMVVCPRRGRIRTRPSTSGLAAAGADMGADGAPDRWLTAALERTLVEVEGNEPGAPEMLRRLTELLYLEVLRGYMRRLPAGEQGWLAGIQHPDVGRALRLLHEHPERRWTVDALGHEVGLSRSALAQRFGDVVGEPPMRYLAAWRMQLAQSLLRRSGLTIAQVAARVGYASEAAFERAYKRHVGLPPATWRRRSDASAQ
jgi:AraC-like DNA-binding protein